MEQIDDAESDPTIFTEALQVLFERSRSTYLRLALAGEEDVLAADLDIDAVRRAIGQGSVEELRKNAEAAVALLDAAGESDEAASADETKSCWVTLSPTDLDRLREAVSPESVIAPYLTGTTRPPKNIRFVGPSDTTSRLGHPRTGRSRHRLKHRIQRYSDSVPSKPSMMHLSNLPMVREEPTSSGPSNPVVQGPGAVAVTNSPTDLSSLRRSSLPPSVPSYSRGYRIQTRMNGIPTWPTPRGDY
ncbi:hypothetical protein [Natronorubrum sp. FCH18a]|uniref:hypothetical protein n=1 Tax=Natronorubrum sp. FCH18a TaxID=3447018 RepID=UPI003F516C18